MADINPFNPNSVVVPNLFAGRKDQVLKICKKLSRLKSMTPASFFLVGERGIGKTALAKLILHLAKIQDTALFELNLITAYYCVEKGQGIGSVLQESINTLTLEIENNILEKIGSTLGQLFDKGKIKIGVFDVGIELGKEKTSQKAVNIKDQAVFILSSIMKNIRAEGTGQKDGALIVIDEMHNLAHLKETASILRNIVTSLDVQGLGNISFLLIGYNEDANSFFSIDTSSRRTFDSIELGVMPKQEAMEVLIKGFEEANVKHDAQALETNIDLAGGYPHSIQMLGHHLMDIDTDNYIDSNDWEVAVVKTAYELVTKDFSKMFSFGKTLSFKDKIVFALAHENKPMAKSALEKSLGNKNCYQHLPALRKLGAIKEDEEGNLVLQSQLLRTAILIDRFVYDKKGN